ncbi:MAG TPA: hypothetical protein VHD31_01460 [Candidatus Paceibacterota bacterium]|nr:hypothetical protein [Candidatus Paceibacterota bacterium]
MKAWPLEEQEDHYMSHYSAYLINEEAGHKDTAEHQRRQLDAMREFWGFSAAEVAVMEGRTAMRLARTKEFIRGVLGEDWGQPPSKH